MMELTSITPCSQPPVRYILGHSACRSGFEVYLIAGIHGIVLLRLAHSCVEFPSMLLVCHPFVLVQPLHSLLFQSRHALSAPNRITLPILMYTPPTGPIPIPRCPIASTIFTRETTGNWSCSSVCSTLLTS
ncbi:hypothetical protein PENTCL1PPCAC_1893 [Pristionchus entomophagus]|uniref:G protein-coupled receptor n=1 Tax=Pristionchus entomophagus TaxID=358040 RepID=A0AAV5SI12_9BILA|nr:hypothetical protein PENTCL1PPCAC_1893 [Pristionchus entomophagus]